MYDKEKEQLMIKKICEIAEENECGLLELSQACRAVMVAALAQIGADAKRIMQETGDE